MMLRVGGGSGGGIHGAHLNPDVEIRYAASDPKRQTIPWVEWRNKRTGATRQYLAKGAKTPPEAERHGMQCVDCHNRPAHSFEKPEGALDRAISAGAIAPSLPWVKKTASELLTASYASQEAASDAIAKAFQSRYGDRPEAKRAAAEVTAIFARNVFPDLKVSWGTYPNNLGHTDSPGCFRCHDGEHSSKDGQSIAQDCASCHEMLAVEEADPEVLKKLNLSPQPQGETK
jgi:formate-dependent nitrite reductase cytochrome c552 subunit